MRPFGRKKASSGEGNKPSVLGTRLGEARNKLRTRMLPKGGVREEGLKVDEAALAGVASKDDSQRGSKRVRIAIVIAAVFAVLLVAAIVGVSLLARTSVFTITSIDTQATDHLTADNIARLARVQKGATLLNIDTDAVEQNLERNPWVGSVRIRREFPDRLAIEVTERRVSYVVAMGSGSVAWYLGEGNVWIEPVKLDVTDNSSVVDAALSMADSLGAVLIADVPPSVSPVAGATCSDDSIKAAISFQEQFSQDFGSQIAAYSASSADGISCTLKSGVEVVLGSVSNVDSKEAVIKSILEQNPDKVTYINVRVPTSPTYRKLDEGYIQQGTGAAGTSTEGGSQFSNNVPDSTMLTQEQIDEATTTSLDPAESSNGTGDDDGNGGSSNGEDEAGSDDDSQASNVNSSEESDQEGNSSVANASSDNSQQ